MNFQTILEELDRLYEEAAVEVAEEEAVEEAVEETQEEDALTEDIKTDDADTSAEATEEITEAAEEEAAEDTDELGVEEPAVDAVKLVLECANCGAVTIRAETDVNVDEETDLANVDEACQYCEETAGYKVLGELTPYDAIEIVDDEVDEDDADSDEELDEGIFDSKAKKEKAYQEEIKKIFGNSSTAQTLAPTIASKACAVIAACCSEHDRSEGTPAKAMAQNIITLSNSAKGKNTKSPYHLIKSIIALGVKYAHTSYELDELKEFVTKVSKLQTGSKNGYKAMEFLMDKVNQAILTQLATRVNTLKREYGIR